MEKRDLAIIDLLYSTGIRVGELVNHNIDDIDWKGENVLFMEKVIKTSIFWCKSKSTFAGIYWKGQDNNQALFVTLDAPHDRLKISGVEIRLRQLGRRLDLERIHPHKFRRTATQERLIKGCQLSRYKKYWDIRK